MIQYQRTTFQQIAANTLRIPQTIDTGRSRYIIERPVNFDAPSGQVGSAQALVYKAEDVATGTKVAIKQVLTPHDAGACERHRRECLFLLSGTSHPNTVEAIEEFQDGNERFLIVKWLTGEPVGVEIRRDGPVSSDIAARRLVTICKVLHFVHRSGWLFRDINEGNVFVAAPGSDRITVLDFGGILPIGSERHTRLLPPSAAPESFGAFQAGGKNGFSAQSDVYAVAALGYFMLTGHTVPDDRAGTPLIPLHRLAHHVDRNLAAAISAGLELDPRRRPATPAAFRQMIESGPAQAALPPVRVRKIPQNHGLAANPIGRPLQTFRNHATRCRKAFTAAACLVAALSLAWLAGASHGHMLSWSASSLLPRNASRSHSQWVPSTSPLAHHTGPRSASAICRVAILGRNVRMRKTPGLGAGIVGCISAPKRVKVLGRAGGWLHIACDDGTQGYVWGAFASVAPGYDQGQVRHGLWLGSAHLIAGEKVLVQEETATYVAALLPDGSIHRLPICAISVLTHVERRLK